MKKPLFTVVIFTCSGREHLLAATWASFSATLENFPHRRILAIDGRASSSTIEYIQPHVIVQNFNRLGYIHSILNALSLVDSELFLWLEDDWEIKPNIDIAAAIDSLQKHPDWMQVRWSKVAPLKVEDYQLDENIKFSSVGFSANPSVCRTDIVKLGFSALVKAQKGNGLGIDGFENFLTTWSLHNNFPCAVVDPGATPMIDHSGYLESTGREWHMTASLVEKPAKYLSAIGSPPLWRRIWMIVKLIKSSTILGARQLMDDESYNLAFRIVASQIQNSTDKKSRK